MAAPAARIPPWFCERNTVLQGDSIQAIELQPDKVGIEQLSDDLEDLVNAVGEGGDSGDGKGTGGASPPGHRYILSQAIWKELCASVRAGLKLPASKNADEPSAMKAHLVLQYPGDGGILFLDAVVKKLATSLNTNLITLNAQDIAELYGEQAQDEFSAHSSISTLGYEVYHQNRGSSKELDEYAEDGEEPSLSEEEDSDTLPIRRPHRESIFARAVTLGGDLPDIMKSSPILQEFLGGRGVAKVLVSRSPDRKDEVAQREDIRCLSLINKLLSLPIKKPYGTNSAGDRATNETASEQPISDQSPSDLIIQIQDYSDIQSTRGGMVFLRLLHKAVQARRKDGQQIVIVGTVSARETELPLGRQYPKLAQRDYDDQFSGVIVVTPAMNPRAVDEVFTEDLKRRIFEVNVRHLQNMLKIRLNEPTALEQSVLNDRIWPLDVVAIRDSGLEEGYWSFNRVHRVVTLALGCAEAVGQLDLQQIQRGIELAERSDRVKGDWMAEKYPKTKFTPIEADKEARLKQLRKSCNLHEKKLLSGVVDADSIRTTFADVHAPKETVEALKTLTSLSLIRPEAFTYGVLSTDKIPGLLLYGPPGTGKTLLAKAVARESGATVLEVSGSEVYDMYVGEGEKNVKAIFTLAKKLSPCVVFIDEADAIFCSRTGASTRTTHRELINQFLREWDGMSDLSAFIMVATNRPFDLDDAVLRRLPRRLLVDLPTEEDRLAILKIHLKEEVLDPAVDLADLARRTPLYSGSDLKNMCVAAALACVREENDQATCYRGDEPYQYPKRRILTPTHFERAMDEISASINEDMMSLSAIRKFDEKYGDRKGRRKKSSGWGFTSPSAAEIFTETGRVRN
jgi:DNA replication protein DnaC